MNLCQNNEILTHFLKNRRIARNSGFSLNIACGNADYGSIRADIKKTKTSDIQCDIRKLPFRNNSFETALCFHTLEHLHKNDTLIAQKELSRVAQKVIIRLPHPLWAWLNPQHKSIKIFKRFYALWGG